MTFSLRVIETARSHLPSYWIYYLIGGLGWEEISYSALLAQSDTATVLIGGDFPPDDSPISDIWLELGETYAGADGREKMRLHRSPQSLVDQLARLGVQPEDVTHVVITPLISYTAGTLDLFPNAELLLGEQGWLEFMLPDRRPDDPRPRRHHREPLPRECVVPRDQLHYLLDHWDRVRILDDTGDAVVGGLTTWRAGAHHRSSLAVRIPTDEGAVIWSDAAFHNANVVDDVPIGVVEDLRECRDSYARIRRESDLFLAASDPDHLRRYPDGVVTISQETAG